MLRALLVLAQLVPNLKALAVGNVSRIGDGMESKGTSEFRLVRDLQTFPDCESVEANLKTLTGLARDGGIPVEDLGARARRPS